MNKKTVTVVGLGKIAIGYDLGVSDLWLTDQTMTHTKAVLESNNFELKYLVDNDLQVLTRVREKLPEVLCETLDKVLELPATNLVIISTPTSSHLEVVRAISIKWSECDYLIEKPVGMDSSEANEIFDLLQKSHNRVAVNYFRRFLPAYTELKHLEIFRTRGALLSIFLDAYGSLANIFSHFFDLILFLEGSKALTLERKTLLLDQPNRKTFMMEDSGVLFDLDGIESDKKDCSLIIKYEMITINISRDGSLIKIFDKNDVLIFNADIEPMLYAHYQSVVLNQIYSEYYSHDAHSRILDAIHIHKFIESI